MADIIVAERQDIVNIADAVRSKTGKSDKLTLNQIASEVSGISTVGGGTNTSDATATAAEIMSGKTAYVKSGKVTGTFTIDNELSTQDILISQIITAVNELPEAGSGEPNLQTKTVTPTTSAQTVKPDSGYDGLSQVTVNAMTTATQATPSISVSSSGLITASSTQTAGYVAAGTKSATKQLTTKAAATYTPTTSNQTIAAGTYCSGAQTIKGDANLVAGNIKSGVSIFGVAGSYEGSGGGSGGGGGGSVETCTVTISGFIGSMPWDIDHMLYVYATICDAEGLTTYKNCFGGTLTIPNVVRGTVLTIIEASAMTQGFDTTGAVTNNGTAWAYIGAFTINGDGTITSW